MAASIATGIAGLCEPPLVALAISQVQQIPAQRTIIRLFRHNPDLRRCPLAHRYRGTADLNRSDPSLPIDECAT